MALRAFRRSRATQALYERAVIPKADVIAALGMTAAAPPAPTAADHNRVLKKATDDALALEPQLAAILAPILVAAGDEAAKKFSAKATDNLTASAAVPALTAAPGVTSSSTMIALKPLPDEAQAMALEDGERPEDMHVTLAFLGQLPDDADIGRVVAALGPVAAGHAPLEGQVGGAGAFGDNGKGSPVILLPSVPGLVELRVAVTQALVRADVDYGRQHGYQPHITADYVKGDLPALPNVAGQPLHFGSILVVRGDVTVAELPLTGAKPITASGRRVTESGIAATLRWQRDHPGEAPPMPAHIAALAGQADPRPEIAAVAEANEPEGGYGQTAWNSGTKAVFWVSADWTENDEIDAARDAFLAIDGVESFDEDAECALPTGDGWEQVWPPPQAGRASMFRLGRSTFDANPGGLELRVVRDDASLTADAGDLEKIQSARAKLEQRQAALRDALEGGDDAQVERAKHALADARAALRDVVAAPQWSSPAGDELIDAKALAQTLRTKTDPIRQQAVKDTMLPTLEGVGLSFDATNPLTAKVLAQSGSQITGIAETTQLNVTRIIKESYAEGLSIPDTAKAIQVGMRSASIVRATLIARTELVGAVNGGSLAATRLASGVTGVGYDKVWLTAPGAKYPRHEEYDGLDNQVQPLDQAFSVGESQLLFPGDPAGPPEDVCNCRCTMIYQENGKQVGDVVDAETATEGPPELDEGDGGEAGQALLALPAPTSGPNRIIQDSLAPGSPGAPPPAPEPAPEPAGQMTRLAGDTYSAPAAPYLDTAQVDQISSLGGLEWPADAPRSADIYRRDGVWDADRAKEHVGIVEQFFAGKVPAEGTPKAYFTAGGAASGKGGARFALDDGSEASLKELGNRPDTVLIDPDRVKEAMPDFVAQVAAGNPLAAAYVHEESAYIARLIEDEARKRGVSVVLDTTGSGTRFTARMNAYAESGYDAPNVMMVSIPTNDAIGRSLERGAESGRYIELNALKSGHAGASRNLQQWMNDPAVATWRLYANDVPRGQPPVLVAAGGSGNPVVVYDQTRFNAILAKAEE